MASWRCPNGHEAPLPPFIGRRLRTLTCWLCLIDHEEDENDEDA